MSQRKLLVDTGQDWISLGEVKYRAAYAANNTSAYAAPIFLCWPMFRQRNRTGSSLASCVHTVDMTQTEREGWMYNSKTVQPFDLQLSLAIVTCIRCTLYTTDKLLLMVFWRMRKHCAIMLPNNSYFIGLKCFTLWSDLWPTNAHCNAEHVKQKHAYLLLDADILSCLAPRENFFGFLFTAGHCASRLR